MKKLLTILLTGILLSAAVFADTRSERPGPPPPPGRKGGVKKIQRVHRCGTQRTPSACRKRSPDV